MHRNNFSCGSGSVSFTCFGTLLFLACTGDAWMTNTIGIGGHARLRPSLGLRGEDTKATVAARILATKGFGGVEGFGAHQVERRLLRKQLAMKAEGGFEGMRTAGWLQELLGARADIWKTSVSIGRWVMESCTRCARELGWDVSREVTWGGVTWESVTRGSESTSKGGGLLWLRRSASTSSIAARAAAAAESAVLVSPLSPLRRTLSSAVCGVCVGLFLVLSTVGTEGEGAVRMVRPPAVYAAVATEESRVVGEAWKVLDKAFVDKSFNGLDWQAVRKQYVKPTYKSTEDAYAAIREMTAKLGDKYTRFLSPAQYLTLASMYTSDQPTAGIGVEVILEPSTNAITILSTISGSPAEKAGLKKGDVITKVGSVVVGQKGGGASTPDDCAALLRGTPGTDVTISVKGALRDRQLTLTREVLASRRVSSKLADLQGTQVGVIKIPSFSQDTSAQVVAAGGTLLEKGVAGIVLDLRGNVGGYFPAAVELGRELLPQDMTIVSVRDNAGDTSSYRTEVTGQLSIVPLAVLVDKNTASAAEVLVAALKENARATVVGEPTFGKGLIQTIAKLQDGSALVVTVARYQTPLNNDINKVGITPDVKAECGKDEDVKCIPKEALQPSRAVAGLT
eukprot:CAMPEP_0181297370 /NCGR_PEP_ID=MMETSP1101-20121128/5203_1 /TAXON_ID=46948 /ORGANISM="Rhodomonas abbreviata, Strain Caron Lab Isolate" /LENGTH=623 /DNA_ID=CAMNT_0023402301 /DNA_START=145 /DNA_END=2016 /DNA_ORIENTATION=-